MKYILIKNISKIENYKFIFLSLSVQRGSTTSWTIEP